MESKYMLLLEDADMLEVRGVKNRDVQVFSISLSNPSKDTISFSGIDETDLNLCESDTSANNVQCGFTSPYFVVFFIFFVILSIVFFMVILWNAGLQDFSQPKK
ncbi:unnamed protein product [Orchesella dallaii]|uniref:Uncharacterized protein n=1 Tax=Orchesella dallaii TaxID=48710 RepID=A0ABP1PI94_9HEXA